VHVSITNCSLSLNSLAGINPVLIAYAGLVLAAHDLCYVVSYWRRHWHVVTNYCSHLEVFSLFLEEIMHITCIYTW